MSPTPHLTGSSESNALDLRDFEGLPGQMPAKLNSQGATLSNSIGKHLSSDTQPTEKSQKVVINIKLSENLLGSSGRLSSSEQASIKAANPSV